MILEGNSSSNLLVWLLVVSKSSDLTTVTKAFEPLKSLQLHSNLAKKKKKKI